MTQSHHLETNGQDLVKNFGAGPTCLFGTVKSAISPTLFKVELSDGRVVRWHLNHMSECEAHRPELVSPEIHNRNHFEPTYQIIGLSDCKFKAYSSNTRGAAPVSKTVQKVLGKHLWMPQLICHSGKDQPGWNTFHPNSKIL